VGEQELQAMAQNEVFFHSKLSPHPHIVSYVDSVIVADSGWDSHYILMEYCSNSLMNFVAEQHHLKEQEVLHLFRQACEAVKHLHSQTPPIAHRDIKVENFLFGRDGLLKLCDFGSCSTDHQIYTDATTITLVQDSIRKCTTPHYRAPEQVDLHTYRQTSEMVDIWALGVLLYKLCYHTTPFEDGSGNVENLSIMSGKVEFPNLGEDDYSDELLRLIKKTLQVDQKTRPTATMLLQKVSELEETIPTVHREETEAETSKPRSTRHKAKSTAPQSSEKLKEYETLTLRSRSPTSRETFPQPLGPSSRSVGSNLGIDAPKKSYVQHFSMFPTQKKGSTPQVPVVDAGTASSQFETARTVAPSHKRSWITSKQQATKSPSPKSSTAQEQENSTEDTQGTTRSRNTSFLKQKLGGVSITEKVKTRVYKLMGSKESERKLWILKATNIKLKPPKAKYVRKVILATWEDTFTGADLFEGLRRRPLGQHPIVALKALITLAKVLQQGPPKLLIECAAFVHDIEAVGSIWSRKGSDKVETEQKDFYCPDLNKLIVDMALVLSNKLYFHDRNPEFSDFFSALPNLDKSSEAIPSDLGHGRELSALSRLLILQQVSEKAWKQAFSLWRLPGKRAVVNLPKLVAATFMPLVEEAYLLFLATTSLLGRVLKHPTAQENSSICTMRQQYEAHLEALRAFFRDVQFVEAVVILNRMPTLPEKNPLSENGDLKMWDENLHVDGNDTPALSSKITRKLSKQESAFPVVCKGWFHTDSSLLVDYDSNSPSNSETDMDSDDDEGSVAFDPYSFQSSPNHLQAISFPEWEDREFQLPSASVGSQVSPDPVEWTCQVCTLVNAPMTSSCFGCGSDKSDNTDWECSYCHLKNNQIILCCAACDSPKSPDKGTWACPSCSLINSIENAKCGVCESEQPLRTLSGVRSVSSVSSVIAEVSEITPPDDLLSMDFSLPSNETEACNGFAPPYLDDIPELHAQPSQQIILESLSPEDQIAIRMVNQQPWVDRLNQPERKALHELLEYFESSTQVVDIKDLILHQVVGTGAFATVFKCVYRTQTVALKKLTKGNGHPVEKMLKDFHSEAMMMSRLNHPNIVALLGTTKVPLGLLMEFCPRGTLFSLVADTHVPLDWPTKKRMAIEIAQGIQYLHMQSIIHRDLKSLNLLITDTLSVKVTDFGISRFKANTASEIMTGQAGTYHWMAPEVINSEFYSEKADVYSYAIILWEIYTRGVPYDGMQPVQVIAAVVHRGERPRIPLHCPEPLAQLMKQCWHVVQTNRPSFTTILEELHRMN